MADSITSFLSRLNPASADKYVTNGTALKNNISIIDTACDSMFKPLKGRSFMIYHPNLAYLARDYGLVEVPVEFEGKEPPPSHLKRLIDLARKENIRAVFVQKEYDTKNARAIADEINAGVYVIDPLAENWLEATAEIIGLLEATMTVQ
jgi:zinc transport system substrate-binding protein